MSLPPDPEGMNDARAEWAGKAIAAFRQATGSDKDTVVRDLLCDIAHWCDRNKIDFLDELTIAGDHYKEETAA